MLVCCVLNSRRYHDKGYVFFLCASLERYSQFFTLVFFYISIFVNSFLVLNLQVMVGHKWTLKGIKRRLHTCLLGMTLKKCVLTFLWRGNIFSTFQGLSWRVLSYQNSWTVVVRTMRSPWIKEAKYSSRK